MAYSDELVKRLRKLFQNRTDVVEKKMFGGLTFMAQGHMCCGVAGEDLMVRVGPDQYEDSVLLTHARPMDITGRSMKGFVFVGPSGLKSDNDLKDWVDKGIKFVSTLPPR